jgi:hypothetical protein
MTPAGPALTLTTPHLHARRSPAGGFSAACRQRAWETSSKRPRSLTIPTCSYRLVVRVFPPAVGGREDVTSVEGAACSGSTCGLVGEAKAARARPFLPTGDRPGYRLQACGWHGAPVNPHSAGAEQGATR